MGTSVSPSTLHVVDGRAASSLELDESAKGMVIASSQPPIYLYYVVAISRVVMILSVLFLVDTDTGIILILV